MTQQVSTNLSMTTTEPRLGLVPLQISRCVMHKLSVPIDLLPPIYSTEQRGMIPRVRTKVAARALPYEVDKVTGVRTRALKGAMVELEAQDFNTLEEDLQKLVRWTCRHPECLAENPQGWATKADLIRDHGDQRQLLAEARQQPNAKPHLYYGILEVAGSPAQPEKKEGDKVVQKASPGKETIVMILSEERAVE